MLVAREEVTIRERGSPPWAFALAQVRIRSADGRSQSGEDFWDSGHRWPKWVARVWCPLKRPGVGVEETPVQLRRCGWVAVVDHHWWFLWPRAQELAHADQGKLDRLGSSTYA